MQIFTVYSIGCNAELFAANYGEYIADTTADYFGGVEFNSAHRPSSAPK